MSLLTLLEFEPKDSLGVAISEKINEISSMSFGEIWQNLLESCTHWGLKLLAAILIYVVGAWLIKKVRKILVKLFNKRNFDPSLSSFLISFVNITLTVLLLIVVITILGIP